MTLENAGSSNIDNANTPAVTAAPETPSSGSANLDLSNPFAVGDLLEQSGMDFKPNVDNVKTPPTVDDANKTDADPENKGEAETTITPEDAEKFIQQDPSLQKIKEYESLGYTKEDATKLALGIEGTAEIATIPEEDYKIVDIKNNPYLQLTDQDKLTVERMATNPTAQDFINYLNRAEKKMAESEGRNPEFIAELPEYEDAATNTLFKKNLIDSVKAEYQQHHRNLQNAESTLVNNQKVQQDFNQRLSGKLIKEFPMLAAEDDKANIVAQYFQDQMFAKRANMLDPQKKSDLKELEKVFDKCLKDFKPLMEPLCKHLGISFNNNSNPQGNAADLAQYKMQQMSNVNNSQASSGGTTINPRSVDASNPIEVGKLLTSMGIV